MRDRTRCHDELGNARCVRPIGGRVRRNPVSNLSRHSNSRADQRTPAVSGPCADGTVGRSDRVSARHPETAAIFLRGMGSFADLDAVSKLRFSAFFNRLINIFEGMYFSHRQGILTGSSWGAVERTMSDLIAYPGVQQWWETRRHWHTEEFNHRVGELITKGSTPKAFSTYNLQELAPKTGT